MKTLYKSDNHWNHYRIKSARASWWDYGQNGIYYVTICTKHRSPFFGTIRNGKMHLSEAGKIAKQCWLDIPKYTQEGVRMEEFVILPNHIHGIIVLDRKEGMEPLQTEVPVETVYYQSQQEYLNHPPHPHSDHPPARSAYFAQIRPKKGSLPQILRSFKAVVTKRVRELEVLGPKQPLWQARYYDRVVRDEREKKRIVRYLQNEVQEWTKDDYYYDASTIAPNHSEEEPLLHCLGKPMGAKVTAHWPSSEWRVIYSIWQSRWLFYLERGLMDAVLQTLNQDQGGGRARSKKGRE